MPRRRLLDALKSPFGVAEVPVRVTTFTQKDPASDKARIVVAAEIGQPGGEPEEYTVGYVLLDTDGKVVSGDLAKRTLSVPEGRQNAPRDYLGEIIVEPGNYSLRFGVVDTSGRRGGVIREVNAWKLGGEEFALGDLLVGDAGSAEGAPRIRPGVEPHVRGNLGAFLELYSTAPNGLDNAKVDFEIADDQDTPALLTATAQMIAGSEPTQRVGQGRALSHAAAGGALRRARAHHAWRQRRGRTRPSLHPRSAAGGHRHAVAVHAGHGGEVRSQAAARARGARRISRRWSRSSFPS